MQYTKAHPTGHQKGSSQGALLLFSTTEQIETKTAIQLCTEAELGCPDRPVVGSTKENAVFFT